MSCDDKTSYDMFITCYVVFDIKTIFFFCFKVIIHQNKEMPSEIKTTEIYELKFMFSSNEVQHYFIMLFPFFVICFIFSLLVQSLFNVS